MQHLAVATLCYFLLCIAYHDLYRLGPIGSAARTAATGGAGAGAGAGGNDSGEGEVPAASPGRGRACTVGRVMPKDSKSTPSQVPADSGQRTPARAPSREAVV